MCNYSVSRVSTKARNYILFPKLSSEQKLAMQVSFQLTYFTLAAFHIRRVLGYGTDWKLENRERDCLFYGSSFKNVLSLRIHQQ